MELRKRIKSVAGFLAYALKLHRYLLGDRAVVVAFHRISNSPSGLSLNCRLDVFEALCKFFRRHFSVVPLSELIQRLKDGKPVGNALAITFDDGYKDNFEVAAPVLRNHGLPATFFIATGFMGSNTVPFWDEEEAVQSEWMDWSDVAELRRMGFDVGGHTVNHIDLGTAEATTASREINECRAVLEQKLDTPVRLFAYPFGGTDNIRGEAIEIVAQAGFECCLSCHGGIVSADDDLFQLHREPLNTWIVYPYQYGFELLVRAMGERA